MIRRVMSKGVLDRLNWFFWELLIVVAGVLIAFAANDYWIERQERELEREYIARLLEDLKKDHAGAEEFFNIWSKRKLQALEFVAPVARSKAPFPEDLEHFFHEVSLAGMNGIAPAQWVTLTTWDDLRATGNFRLIRDSDIRDMLTDYHAQAANLLNRFSRRTTGYALFVTTFLPGELRDEFNWNAVEDFGVERAMKAVRSEEFNALLNKEFNYAWFSDQNGAQQVEESSRTIDALSGYLEELNDR